MHFSCFACPLCMHVVCDLLSFLYLLLKDFALNWILTFTTAQYFRVKLLLCCCWTVLVRLRQVWANRQMEALEVRARHRALCFLRAWPMHSLRWCSKAKEMLLFRVLLTWMAGHKATWQATGTNKVLNQPSSVGFNYMGAFIDLLCSSSLHSMFSQQQTSPQFSQQNNNNMYNSNGMNLNSVSMATNMATSSMGQMAGQMNVTSMASGPSPGLPSMGQEQVNTRAIRIQLTWKWIHIKREKLKVTFTIIHSNLWWPAHRIWGLRKPKSFIVLLFKCGLCRTVTLVNNLLPSLLNFSCWTRDACLELRGHWWNHQRGTLEPDHLCRLDV